MKLDELIKLADWAYDGEGRIQLYYEDPKGDHGDLLAHHIAVELQDSYQLESTDNDQLEAASDALRRAIDQLERVIDNFNRERD